VISTIAILLLLVGNGMGFVARASNNTDTMTPAQGIPAPLLAYITAHPPSGPIACISGTIDPFSVTSTKCNNSAAIAKNLTFNQEKVKPMSSSTINCSTYCSAGTYNYATGSTNFDGWTGYATVPSNPSTSYSSPSTLAYWLGSTNCAGVGTCSLRTYILQAGLIYGTDGSSNSHHPYMFVNFYDSGGLCDTAYSCGTSATVSVGDTMYFDQVWLPVQGEWDVYAEDQTASTYVELLVAPGTGGYPPNGTTGIPYGAVAMEAYSASAASDYPSGGVSFTTILGANNNSPSTPLLGTSVTFFNPVSGSGRTATVSYSTYSCGSYTCADESIGVT